MIAYRAELLAGTDSNQLGHTDCTDFGFEMFLQEAVGGSTSEWWSSIRSWTVNVRKEMTGPTTLTAQVLSLVNSETDLSSKMPVASKSGHL